MLWKECHVARTTVLTRFLTLLAVLAIAVPLGLETWRVRWRRSASWEVKGAGIFAVNRYRDELNGFLRPVLVVLYIAMTVAVTAIGIKLQE